MRTVIFWKRFLLQAGTSLLLLAAASLLFVSNVSANQDKEPSYRPYDDVVRDLEMVAGNNPDIVTLVDLSSEFHVPFTHQGRSLQALRISDRDENGDGNGDGNEDDNENDDVNEREPGILITGCHHGREWISVEVPLHFIHYLVDNYQIDPYVTYLIDNRDIWIVPVVNPDGYVKSWEDNDRSHNWTGWRKNCRDNDGNGVIDSADGVDLNRNYGYMWGYDDNNSSPYLANQFYRGPAPFSEPETQAIRALAEKYEFEVSLHYHSAGGMNIYPWAYIDSDTEDQNAFVVMGQQMARYNGYIYNNSNNSEISNANGEVTDWMYGSFGTLAFTIELGTFEDRFIPDESRIIPICEENLEVNLYSCFIADASDGLLFHTDPERTPILLPSHNLSHTWNLTGIGGNWSMNDDGLIGDSCWNCAGTGDSVINASLLLAHPLTSGGGNRFLSFWSTFQGTNGTSLMVGLVDPLGNLEIVKTLSPQPGRSDTLNEWNQDWAVTTIDLSPFLSETVGKNITFIFSTNGSSSSTYSSFWNIDAITISSGEPILSDTITLSAIPRAHIDRITPWDPIPSDTLHFYGHGTDDGEISQYMWSDMNETVLSTTSDPSFLPGNFSLGEHTISLKVQDDTGIWSTTVNITFVVHQRPVATIAGVPPLVGTAGVEVLLIASATDDGSISSYVWHLDGSEFSRGTSPEKLISIHSPGNYTISLTVIDNKGAVSEEAVALLIILPDTDGDGMADSSDSFPNDPAASIDRDRDGYPDVWNEGRTQEDSTTSLELDRYPEDPSRWEKQRDSDSFLPFLPGPLIAVVFVICAFLRHRRK
jgi:hypothetical protein